jgi:hypothetical protein
MHYIPGSNKGMNLISQNLWHKLAQRLALGSCVIRITSSLRGKQAKQRKNLLQEMLSKTLLFG